MSIFDNELALGAEDMLSPFGDDVYVNGALHRGIINDENFDDEAGEYRDLSVSFLVKDAVHIKVGDTIQFDDNVYEVRKLPRENKEDPFYTVELVNA